MQEGRLLADATREELLERSATHSVEDAFLQLVEERERTG
jgi:hypothetical protein